jgi:hypothetical protein
MHLTLLDQPSKGELEMRLALGTTARGGPFYIAIVFDLASLGPKAEAAGRKDGKPVGGGRA